MFGSMLESFRSSPTKNDPNSIVIDERKSRKREIVVDNQATDILQTPPNKRAKNTGQGPTTFFSNILTCTMNFTSKFHQRVRNYMVRNKDNDKPKRIETIDLEAEGHENIEIKSSTSDQDVVYLGTKSRDDDICENKQRSGYNMARKNKGEKSEQLKPTSIGDNIMTRKPLQADRWEKESSYSDIQSFTPMCQPDDQARRHIVYTIPDEPSLHQDDWKNKTYNVKRYEEVKEKKNSFPIYRRAPEAPKPLTHHQKSTLLIENKAFQNNFNVGQKPAASKLQGKIRVRHTKESPRKTVLVRRHRSTANDVIRLEEKERYMQLLSQFTTCVSNTFSDKTSICNKENSIITITSHSPDKSIFDIKPPELHRKTHRSTEGSVLSPRSSLRPSHQTFHHSPSLSPAAHPTVLKVMPSATKAYRKSEHVEDLLLYSKQESVGLFDQSTIFTRTPQPAAKEDEILSGTWTKKWRRILSPENLQRERELSKIAREEHRLQLLKDKRREEQVSAIEEVRERIRIEEESEEEEEAEEPVFIPLSEEMEREVDGALGPGNLSETLADGFKISVTRGDMATLSNLNWLNDEIINIYFSLIAERSKIDGYPKVHTFNSFFYPKLIKSGYDSLKRWTRRVDIFVMDMIIVPIHLGMHWCLAVIDFRYKTIKYFDSLKGSNNQCLDALQKYLAQESVDKKKVPYDITGWSLSCPKDIPEQLNGCDCGVFACKYAEFITRDAKFTFNQHHMPYFRRRMVYEILKMKLL